MVLTIIVVVVFAALFALALGAMWYGTVHGDLIVTVASSHKPRRTRD